MQKKTCIVHYNVGNIRSIQKTCQYLGHSCEISKEKKTIEAADLLILPGQGAFKTAKQSLDVYGLSDLIKAHIDAKKPTLAVCIGFQLLFEGSDEAPDESGLNLFQGSFKQFKPKQGFPVPHMGWNSVSLPDPFKKQCPDDLFYFVHSYYTQANPETCFSSNTHYQHPFTSLLYRQNLLATQFHPEKSGQTGLALLNAFFKTLEY